MTRAPLLRAAPLLLVAASCAGPSGPDTRTPAPTSSASVAKRTTASQLPAAATPPCTPDARRPKSTAGAEDRKKAIRALAAGRALDAMRGFERVLEENPGDIVAFTLHAAANADLVEERLRAGRNFGRLKALKIEPAAPPHKTFVKSDKKAAKLTHVAEEKHTGDWYGWLSARGIANPIGFGGEGEMPGMFGENFGDQPVYATHTHEGYSIVRYGPAVLVLGQESTGMRAMTLEPFIMEAFKGVVSAAPDSIFPEVRYAEISGSTLVVEIAHEGDGGKTLPDGVVLGFDLAADKLLWVSDARVGNAYTGFTTATHFVTSFTDATGGKLNVLDLATGAVVASEALPMRTDYVVGKGNTVYAWGYDRSIAFELSPSAEPLPVKLGSVVSSEGAQSAGLEAAQVCWLENAALALDHRDAKATLDATAKLPEDLSARRAVDAAAGFVEARASGAAGLDLTEMSPIAVEYAKAAFVAKDVKSAAGKAPKLKPAKDPVLHPPQAPYPAPPFPVYSNVRTDLYPNKYGIWFIESGWPVDGGVLVVYGRRFAVTVKDNQVTAILDLKPLLGEGAKDTNLAPAYALTVVDGVLYVIVNTQHGYGAATSSSYVAAIDPASGKVLWRTDTGVLARQFMIFGDAMLVAVNREKHGELLLVRRSDGQVLSTTKTKGHVTDLGWDGRGVVYVGLQAAREYFTVQ